MTSMTTMTAAGCLASLLCFLACYTGGAARIALNTTARQPMPIIPRFRDRSIGSGIARRPAFKYGAPMVADLNGDGWDDIVMGEHENGLARVYLRDSGRSFRLAYEHDRQIDYHGMAAYHLQGEENNTLAVVMNQGGVNGRLLNEPDVFEYLGGENFDRRPGSAFDMAHFQTRGRAVLFVDVDLDGHDDMILTGRTQNLYPRPLSEIAVLRNKGPGRGWAPYINLKIKNAYCYTSVLTIDLDNDAIMDLVCTERGRISILRGTGRFPQPFKDVTKKWLGSVVIPDKMHFGYLTDFDYNNDGRMDVYISCGFNFTFFECDDILLRNDGTKFYDVTLRAGIPRGGIHQEPAAGDFNLDGHIDILIPSYGLENGGGGLNLLLVNTGDGSFITTGRHGVNFKAPTPFRGAGASALLVNSWGLLDVVVGYEGSTSFSRGGPYKFYQNITPKRGMNFLAYQVNDIPSQNLLARGAKVTIRIGDRLMMRRVGHAGGNSQSFQRRVHFGIGRASRVNSVVVEYLGGAIRVQRNVRSGFR